MVRKLLSALVLCVPLSIFPVVLMGQASQDAWPIQGGGGGGETSRWYLFSADAGWTVNQCFRSTARQAADAVCTDDLTGALIPAPVGATVTLTNICCMVKDAGTITGGQLAEVFAQTRNKMSGAPSPTVWVSSLGATWDSTTAIGDPECNTATSVSTITGPQMLQVLGYSSTATQSPGADCAVRAKWTP